MLALSYNQSKLKKISSMNRLLLILFLFSILTPSLVYSNKYQSLDELMDMVLKRKSSFNEIRDSAYKHISDVSRFLYFASKIGMMTPVFSSGNIPLSVSFFKYVLGKITIDVRNLSSIAERVREIEQIKLRKILKNPSKVNKLTIR